MSTFEKIRLAANIIDEECQKQGRRAALLTEFDVFYSDRLAQAMLYLGLIHNPRLISYVKRKKICDELLLLYS